MNLNRIIIVMSFVFCSLFVAGIVGYKDYIEYNQKYFVVEMQSPTPGFVQAFFDVGNSYNEHDSCRIQIQSGVLQKYIFPMPKKTIRSIRFDPINRAAVICIKYARIENKQGEVIKKFSSKDFRPIQQILKMETSDGVLILHTTEKANDPIVIIENSGVENQVSWKDLISKHGWKYLGYLLLSFVFVIGLNFLLINARCKQCIINVMRNLKIHIAENPKMSIALIGIFTIILLGIKLWLIGTYGNATPSWDPWDSEADKLYKPFLEGSLAWRDLFALHNEHRIFTTRLLDLALLNINGIWSPMLQMVVNAGLHIAILVLFIVLLARVIGRKFLPVLLIFSLVLFGVPYAWENTLGAFQVQFYFVLLFSITCLWYTITQYPLSVRWWAGVVLGMFAFFSFASGIFPFASAAIISFLLYMMGLRKTRSQLLAVAILAGLFALGAVLTPSLPYHTYLKATSFSQFLYALTAVLGWPISSRFFSALIRNLPAFIFVCVMLWKRPPANDGKWFLLSLVVWSLGTAIGIAYGRAVGNLTPRYLDFFAIGILANFACLISIAQGHIGKRRGWIIAGVSVWTIIVIISLGLYGVKHIPLELAAKRATGLAQEFNTQQYLLTGNLSFLVDKPFSPAPYPVPERLVSILASSTVQAILPSNIRRPLDPISIVNKPANAFVINGYYPSTPKRTYMTLGSYGVKDDATTGEVSIQFDANKHSIPLAIPVAGYPLNSGMKLEVEQNGQRNPVIMKSNPKESWKMAYVKVASDKFTIHLVDSNTTTWLAVGLPFKTGRLDSFINGLLANYLVFIMVGLSSLVVLMTVSGLTSFVTKSIGD